MPMKQSKITQSQIAKKLKITQGAVSGWFTGDSKPTVDNAAKLEEYFGIPAKECADLPSFVKNNTHLFGSLKILRKAKNGSAEV